MFTRCVLCNKILSEVSRDKIKDKVPEYVFQAQDKFLRCDECGRVYWQGTHWDNAAATLQEIIQ